MRFLTSFLVTAGLALSTVGPAAGQQVIVGTAPVAGIYYPVGGALCRVVNARRAEHGLHCLIESTGGSEDNLRRLRAGELQFALVQSDWQYFSGQDEANAEAEPQPALRAVVSLHAQPFTLVVRPDSDIDELKALRGKRLNLGPAGSAQRAAATALIQALGWDEADFAAVHELGPQAQVEALCDGRIDGFLMQISHPNGVVAAAANRCRARLISIEDPVIKLLLATWPFYAPAGIPGGMYPGNPEPVSTFGLRATLVTSSATPEDTVYRVVRALFEQLDTFRSQHPALYDIAPAAMVSQANTLEMHGGALRYYRERDWM